MTVALSLLFLMGTALTLWLALFCRKLTKELNRTRFDADYWHRCYEEAQTPTYSYNPKWDGVNPLSTYYYGRPVTVTPRKDEDP